MKLKTIILTGCIAVATCVARGADPKPQPPSDAINGKVLETTNVSSYTYIQVDTGKQKIWAAAPTFKVKPGDTVSVIGAFPVGAYHSQALNRNFDSVYFTARVLVNGKEAQAAEAPKKTIDKSQLPADHPSLSGGGKQKVELTGIKKADGGLTVEEVFAKKAELKDKTITLRGKVVKFNGKILGKNWIHVKDGTGGIRENDLMVTTSQTVKVGDTVLVTGKVSTDRDFGSGYRWNVIVEDAKVTVEK